MALARRQTAGGLDHLPDRHPHAVWAWEGLRRNNAYRDAYARVRAKLPEVERLRSGGLRRPLAAADAGAERFGLLAFADPHLSAWEQGVFWLPELSTGTLDVALKRLNRAEDRMRNRDRLVLSRLNTRRFILDAGDVERHVILGARRFWIQLRGVRPETLSERAEIIVNLSDPARMRRQSDALRQLLSLHDAQDGEVTLIGRSRSETRLREILTAFDAAARGATYREVAESLLGAERVARDWEAGSDHIKAKAKRAVEAGRHFVRDGYLAQLGKRAI